MRKHEVVAIKNFHDALQVKNIRNQCRLFMTQNTSEISLLNQLIWYFRVYKEENRLGKMTCFLFKYDNNNSGFGLVRQSSGKFWITGGLKQAERGRGLGKLLFKDLIDNTPSKNVWLEVLDTNFIAKKIYVDLGFKKIEVKKIGNKKIIIMKLNKYNLL